MLTILGFFLLGCILEIGIVLYYRLVSGHRRLIVMITCFLITWLPFEVAYAGIRGSGHRLFFIAYSLGAAIGAGIGMTVKL